MVKKSSQKEIGCFDFMNIFHKFDIFTNKFSFGRLIRHSVFLLIVFFILIFLKEFIFGAGFSISEVLMLSIIGLPLLLFIFFIFFYVFLNAFETNRKPFFESFLVFFSIIFPFIIIGNLLEWISSNLNNLVLIGFISVLILIIYLYLVISLILNFKSYYKTTIYRVISSLLLSVTLFAMISLSQYLIYLLSNLR